MTPSAAPATPESLGTFASMVLSRDPADRQRLLLALADLCDQSGAGCAKPEVQAVLHDVFMSVIGQVEHDIRRQLSDKLAMASWAPPALIVHLARDDLEIARPIIARSPLLQDQDLVRLLVESSVEHHIEVARRPRLGAAVVEAILAQGEADVLTALAGNESAEMTPVSMSRLVAFAQTIASLRAPLARHPRLTSDLGGMLYVWVGETLRAALIGRFDVDDEAFKAAVAQAVAHAHGAPGEGMTAATDERTAMDRRVVEKLKAGGQLRPGLLLRALREGKLTLFIVALAGLGEFATDDVRDALESDRSEPLALACAAVGMDRGALPTVLSLVRQLNGDRPGKENEMAGLTRITTTMDKAEAAAAFRSQASVKA